MDIRKILTGFDYGIDKRAETSTNRGINLMLKPTNKNNDENKSEKGIASGGEQLQKQIEKLKLKKKLYQAKQSGIYVMELTGAPFPMTKESAVDFSNFDRSKLYFVPSGLGGAFSLTFKFETPEAFYFDVRNPDFNEIVYFVNKEEK